MTDKLTAADLAGAVGSRKARELLGLNTTSLYAPARTRRKGRLTFVVPGRPIGAPRQTQRDKWKQRPCVVAYRDWKDFARQCAGELPPADQVLALSWTAYFIPPESWSKKKRAAAIGTLHRSKPDRDNIDKAVLDALFAQDAAIAAGMICKRWDWVERLDVTIEIRET